MPGVVRAPFEVFSALNRSPRGFDAVIAGNGRRMDVPVAKRLPNNEFIPVAGVAWIYPPTKNNPQQTIVESR